MSSMRPPPRLCFLTTYFFMTHAMTSTSKITSARLINIPPSDRHMLRSSRRVPRGDGDLAISVDGDGS